MPSCEVGNSKNEGQPTGERPSAAGVGVEGEGLEPAADRGEANGSGGASARTTLDTALALVAAPEARGPMASGSHRVRSLR